MPFLQLRPDSDDATWFLNNTVNLRLWFFPPLVAQLKWGNKHNDLHIYDSRIENHQGGEKNVQLSTTLESLEIQGNYNCPLQITLKFAGLQDRGEER